MDPHSSDTPRSKSRSSLQFEGINQPIVLFDCDELHAHVKCIFRDLTIERVETEAWEDSQITIRKTRDGYERSSHWLDHPVVHYDPIDAVCDLTVDLIHAFVTDQPGFLCLHSAAVLFKKGLFLFPSTYRAGKSTLSLHLAFNGISLFTDDALPVTADNNAGMATGLYPRLRIPLPQSVSEDFKNYVRQRIVLRNDRYCYISLNKNEQLPFGTTAPINGVILLNLDSKKNMGLTPVSKKEAVKEIILRNFARQNKALDIVERIYSIVESASCYRLTYSDPDRAAKLLIQNFQNH